MKIISSFIICFALMSVVSCGTVENSLPQHSNSASGVLIENIVPLSQKDLQAAILANNVEVCQQASTQLLQENCKRDFVLLQAKEQGDYGVCGSLDEESKKSCISSVVLFKAQKEENLEVCKNFSSQDLVTACEDSTNYFLAEKKQDSVFCEKIQDGELKSGCLAVIKKYVDCSKFSNQVDKDKCLLIQKQYDDVMELVKNKKKVNCSTILDMDLRQLCGQEMGMINALERKDKVLCEVLSTSFTYGDLKEKNYKEECVKSFK